MNKIRFGRINPWASLTGLAISIALGSGCDPGPVDGYPGSDGTPTAHMSGSVAGTGGKIFVNWTIGGSAPSSTVCQGVDHILLTLDYGNGSVQIAPIPCTLTRFRYDALPTGDAILSLDALSPSNCNLFHGESQITLDETVPASPTPTIALRAARGCR